MTDYYYYYYKVSLQVASRVPASYPNWLYTQLTLTTTLKIVPNYEVGD